MQQRSIPRQWFSRLVVLDVDAHPRGPRLQLAADVFRAVINPNNQWLSAPKDTLVQAAHRPFDGQREVCLDA